ncbi:MAG: S1C family serine protease, partial [Clostridia bacterium]|nr:S1C family serine protease [Clostridia bacterium]
MKKFKKLTAALIILAATALCVAFGGCDLFGRFFYQHPPLSDYVSTTEISADSLMAVRTKIRAFNISVDTKYYRNMGWVSRTEGTSMGSGVVFEEDSQNYYALTNHHVITNILDGITYSVSYTITDINGVEYTGKLVMSDSAKDIAIVSFRKKSTTSLGKANYTARLETNLTPGEFVLAVGNPSGVNNIVTYGQTVNWARIGNVKYSVIQHT